MKKILLFLLLVLLPINVYADSIESIDTKALILDDGSIKITQIWNATADRGTEFYIPISNLNHMKLVDFYVSDEEGPYTLKEPWDIDASFDEKARKYGINYTSDGIELCFGKSEMKSKTYTINFTYENGVIGFTDADGFNIRFVNDNMKPAPKTVSLVIEKEGTELSFDNAKIWGFGFEGEINFVDGKIVVENTPFDHYNHLTAMVSLDKGIINPSYNVDYSFETMKDRAFEDSEYLNDNTNKYNDSNVIKFIFSLFAGVFVFITSIVALILKYNSDMIAKNISKADKNKPLYYRDAIFDNNLDSIYYILQNEPKILENYISAQLLKWIKAGNIRMEMIKKYDKNNNPVSSKKPSLLIVNTPELNNKMESTLFDYIVNATGNDDILTSKEFKKYLLKKDDFPEKFIKNIKEEGRYYLYDNAYLEKINNKNMLTQKGLEEVSNLYAYKRFLKDFTIINEREPIEVGLWDDILVNATILGLGDKVIKKFKKFYPDYTFANSSSPGDIYLTYNYMTAFSRSTSEVLTHSSYSSSGSGGFTSFGGGGGFSGGGSGGGGR